MARCRLDRGYARIGQSHASSDTGRSSSRHLTSDVPRQPRVANATTAVKVGRGLFDRLLTSAQPRRTGPSGLARVRSSRRECNGFSGSGSPLQNASCAPRYCSMTGRAHLMKQHQPPAPRQHIPHRVPTRPAGRSPRRGGLRQARGRGLTGLEQEPANSPRRRCSDARTVEAQERATGSSVLTSAKVIAPRSAPPNAIEPWPASLLPRSSAPTGPKEER
jgi:hypothetical protein